MCRAHRSFETLDPQGSCMVDAGGVWGSEGADDRPVAYSRSGSRGGWTSQAATGGRGGGEGGLSRFQGPFQGSRAANQPSLFSMVVSVFILWPPATRSTGGRRARAGADCTRSFRPCMSRPVFATDGSSSSSGGLALTSLCLCACYLQYCSLAGTRSLRRRPSYRGITACKSDCCISFIGRDWFLKYDGGIPMQLKHFPGQPPRSAPPPRLKCPRGEGVSVQHAA